jgi:cruciform cutting endonuclease 1
MPTWLAELKIQELKAILRLIGGTVNGTKPVLITSLRNNLTRPRITYRNGRARIISMDMGLQNFAYSVANIKKSTGTDINVEIADWKRLNLLHLAAEAKHNVSEEADTGEAVGVVAERRESEMALSKANLTKPQLASIAYRLLNEHIMPLKPDILLIESQRHRSHGAPSVFEITFRINMFESMLWAVLETLRHENRSQRHTSPIVYPVDPAKVSRYWVEKATSEKDEKSARATPSQVKRAKVNVVSSWLVDKAFATKWPNSSVNLSFSSDADQTRQGFIAKTIDKKDTHKVGKIDDLADCLLQLGTWISWETNRSQLEELQSACQMTQALTDIGKLENNKN